MKRKRFSEEQIIAVLREHEAGAKAADLARKHGISEATLYSWKAKFGGMDVSDARRLKALEEESSKLKKLLADTMARQHRVERSGALEPLVDPKVGAAGWTYSLGRCPAATDCGQGLISLLIAPLLTAYQLGHLGYAWERCLRTGRRRPASLADERILDFLRGPSKVIVI